MAFAKSIIRSLVDGGTQLSDETLLIDRLAEFSEAIGTNKWFALGGGSAQILFGLATATTSPVGFIAIALGGYCLTKVKSNRLTNIDERELRFLSKHRNIFGVLKRLKQRGLDDEEILQSFEAMISRYNIATDEIVLGADHTIPAGNAIAGFEVVTAQILNHDGEPSQPIVAPQSKRSFLNESLKPRQLPPASHVPTMRRDVGSVTRFGEPGNGGAVDVPAQEERQVDEERPIDSVSVLNRTLQRSDEIGLPADLMAVTVTKPYSTFIFGKSEAGKDITLYNIMAALKQAYPQAYFLGIDGKNSPGESELWSIYTKTIRISMRDNPTSYHPVLIDALDTAIDHPDAAFVAFSEVNGISAAYDVRKMTAEWAEVAFRIAYLAIQGNSERKFFYGTAQALNLDALGIKKESRSNVYFCAIANSTQFEFLSQIAGDTRVFNNKLLLSQDAFQSACSRSTATQHLKIHAVLKGIGYFHTALNRWEPMPRLFNPGCDRGETPQVAPMEKPTRVESTPAKPPVQAIEDENEKWTSGCEITDALIDYMAKRERQKLSLREIQRSGCLKKFGITSKADYEKYIKSAIEAEMLDDLGDEVYRY